MPAKIETAGIVVGEPDPNDNEFRLVITDLDTSAKPPAFYLFGTFGPDEKDLFLNRVDAEKCRSETVLPANWKGLWTFKESSGTFELKISTYNKSLEGPSLTVEFSSVTSRTKAGNATLGFGTDPDPKKSLQTLSLAKKPPQQPGIIAFYSDPPEGTLNLTGQTVTLTWLTSGLTDLKLWASGKKFNIGAKDRDRGSRKIDVGSSTESVSLEGFDGAKAFKELIEVKVLDSRWYSRTHRIMPGDPAYPEDADPDGNGLELQPTEVIDANDSRLYAIFRHVFKGSERALLFKAANPFARWDLVESTVPGEQGRLPEGFSESSGVYWDDRIWLIGGSQIDPGPGRTSNLVWRLDPNAGDNPSWENLGPAAWSERMGHAVLVFKNEIWVMGGRDEAGNPLNDVWRLDRSSRNWERVAEHAGWASRCLIHPTVWKDQIWLYGGVMEPFSSTVYDDLWVYPAAGGAWEKLPIMDSVNQNGKPVSSCLQVFRKKVHVFGNFRTATGTSEAFVPYAWSLNDLRVQGWGSFFSEGLKDWGSDTTFSYEVVNFNDTYLVGKALDYRGLNNVLKIYVGNIELKVS